MLVERLAAKTAHRDLAMTTNGVLFARQGRSQTRGPHRVTVSLDTLRPERFIAGPIRRTAAGDRRMEAAADFPGFKIDMVVIKGTNDDEIVRWWSLRRHTAPSCDLSSTWMSAARRGGWDQVMTRVEMLATLAAHYGRVEPISAFVGAGRSLRFPDGTTFGIISSTTTRSAVRPEPAHGRRHVVSLPLRPRGAWICADRCVAASAMKPCAI